MANFKSKTKVKVVGYLDGALSTAIVIQIICCTVYPIIHDSDTLKSNRHDGYFNHQNNLLTAEGRESNSFLIWSYLIACVLVGIIPILAAAALTMSTRPHIGYERTLEITRFWMHCNIFTITLALFEFFVAMIIYLDRDSKIWPPIPTLVYLGFRVAFTLIIRNQLETMSPTLIATLDPDLVEEKRKRYKEINRLPLHERRMQPEFRATMQPPVLPLRPYRGTGLSIPNCECVAPQTA